MLLAAQGVELRSGLGFNVDRPTPESLLFNRMQFPERIERGVVLEVRN